MILREITDDNLAKSFDDLEPLEPYKILSPPDLPWIGSFGNDRLICVRVRTPPSWFHRQMQRWLLGIKWEKRDG